MRITIDELNAAGMEPVKQIEIGVLHVESGDVLVLHHPQRLSQAACEKISRSFECVFRNAGHSNPPKVVILEEGMKAEVWRINSGNKNETNS